MSPNGTGILPPCLFFHSSISHSFLACSMDIEDLAPACPLPPPTTHILTMTPVLSSSSLISSSWFLQSSSSYFDYINIICVQAIVVLWLFFLSRTKFFPGINNYLSLNFYIFITWIPLSYLLCVPTYKCFILKEIFLAAFEAPCSAACSWSLFSHGLKTASSSWGSLHVSWICLFFLGLFLLFGGSPPQVAFWEKRVMFHKLLGFLFFLFFF